MKYHQAPIWLIVAALIGCTASRSPVPPAAEIVKAELSVRALPNGARQKFPCTVTLDAREDLADVRAWLSSIDWSQPGQDMAVILLPQPDGSVTIHQKDGTATTFPFYWDGPVIREKANRLLTGADVTRLRALALRACK